MKQTYVEFSSKQLKEDNCSLYQKVCLKKSMLTKDKSSCRFHLLIAIFAHPFFTLKSKNFQVQLVQINQNVVLQQLVYFKLTIFAILDAPLKEQQARHPSSVHPLLQSICLTIIASLSTLADLFICPAQHQFSAHFHLTFLSQGNLLTLRQSFSLSDNQHMQTVNSQIGR